MINVYYMKRTVSYSSLTKTKPRHLHRVKKAWFGDSKSHHKGGTVSAFNRKEENKPVQNQVSGLTDQGRI